MQVELDGATLVFVVGAAILLIVYFGVAWKARARPDLQQAVIICTAWASFAPAAYLGFQTCVAKAEDLGVLANQRITIILGVAAVMWVSVTTVFGVLSKLLEQTADNDASPASN